MNAHQRRKERRAHGRVARVSRDRDRYVFVDRIQVDRIQLEPSETPIHMIATVGTDNTEITVEAHAVDVAFAKGKAFATRLANRVRAETEGGDA